MNIKDLEPGKEYIFVNVFNVYVQKFTFYGIFERHHLAYRAGYCGNNRKVTHYIGNYGYSANDEYLKYDNKSIFYLGDGRFIFHNDKAIIWSTIKQYLHQQLKSGDTKENIEKILYKIRYKLKYDIC